MKVLVVDDSSTMRRIVSNVVGRIGIDKEDIPINYYYFNEKRIDKLYHRTVFQKHKIKKYYDEIKYDINEYNDEESEIVNLYKNGYRRIYDSGQLTYIKEY